jgi:hypothetical protein
VAYVSAELHAFEGDLCEFGVGLVEGGLEVRGGGGDSEDAASGGDDLSVFEGCAGVEDDHVVAGLIVLCGEAGDGFARGVFSGVAAAGCDDADAGAGAHVNGEFVRGAVDGGVEEIDYVGLEAEEDGFGLGVAEARVELEDHGAARRHHDAAEENAFEGFALRAHAVDYLLRDVVEKPAAHGRGGDAVGGVGPHAAGVEASVAFADALVVLRGGDFDGMGAVAEGEEGELFAGEELFEDDGLFCGAEEGAAEHLGSGGFGLKVSFADDDPFARGETGGFDDDGDGEAGELFADLVECGADAVLGGGEVVALHELFGEGFAGFELGCSLGGSEDAVAAFGELVDEAEGERDLGADDGEGGLLDDDDVDELVEVGRVAGDAAGDGRDAAVAGSAEDLCDLRRFEQSPYDGVLAATTADYQNLHSDLHSLMCFW